MLKGQGPVSMREGKCFEWINVLAWKAPSSLTVVHPPHSPTCTTNKTVPVNKIQVSLSKTKRSCGQRVLVLGVVWKGSFLRVQHLKGFHLWLLDYKAGIDYHFSSQVPEPCTSCETLRKWFNLCNEHNVNIYLHTFVRIKWANRCKVLNSVPGTEQVLNMF